MDDIIKNIGSLLACEYKVIPPQNSGQKVMDFYEKEKAAGEQEGFIPVILVPDEELFRRLQKAQHPEWYLEEYKKHNGKDILDGYLNEIKECLKRQGESLDDVIDTVERGQEIEGFAGFVPDDWEETLEVLLVKVPTTHPWEVFAWIPMGGWRECPPTEYMIAIMKYWYEQYRFYPVVISGDMIEGMVPEKPKTAEEAVAIGIEHYAFCPDLIEQCCSDACIGQWADTMMKSLIWFFWWD